MLTRIDLENIKTRALAAGNVDVLTLLGHVVDLENEIASLLEGANEDVRYYQEEVGRLTKEREAIQNDERVLTCAFCGEAYPPGTPAANHERLTAHVAVCEKHPAAAFRHRAEAAEEAAAVTVPYERQIPFRRLLRVEMNAEGKTTSVTVVPDLPTLVVLFYRIEDELAEWRQYGSYLRVHGFKVPTPGGGR